MIIALLILGLVLFIGLVMMHEWGHYIMARRAGVVVEEFGLFFPPRLYGRKRKHRHGQPADPTVYSVNLLPLGGFVKLKGEHDEDSGEGSFGAASLKQKTKIMLAGVFMNLMVALVLFTIIALVGMPKLISEATIGEEQFTVASDTKVLRSEIRVQYVEPDSPAASIGLKEGDAILYIEAANSCYDSTVRCDRAVPNNQRHLTLSELKSTSAQLQGSEVGLIVRREGTQQIDLLKTKILTTAAVEASRQTDQPKGYLGIVPQEYQVRRSTWSAPVVAVGVSAQLTKLTFKGLGTAIHGLGATIAGAFTSNTVARQNGQEQATEQVSGPLGIFFVLKQGASEGLVFVLFIIAIISLTLAIMNVLPIPALDGGRFYLIVFSRLVLKRPLRQRLEERIVGTSMAALLVLFVVITFVDYNRFF